MFVSPLEQGAEILEEMVQARKVCLVWAKGGVSY